MITATWDGSLYTAAVQKAVERLTENIIPYKEILFDFDITFIKKVSTGKGKILLHTFIFLVIKINSVIK